MESFAHSLIFLSEACTSEAPGELFQSSQTQTVGRQTESENGEGVEGHGRSIGPGLICLQNIASLCCCWLLGRKRCVHSFLYPSFIYSTNIPCTDNGVVKVWEGETGVGWKLMGEKRGPMFFQQQRLKTNKKKFLECKDC